MQPQKVQQPTQQNNGGISKTQQNGGVAHLGERLNGIQEVVGSIPIVSTKLKNWHNHQVYASFFVVKNHLITSYTIVHY